MGDRTGISWTDATWNMIRAVDKETGKRGWHCEHVTEACRNCYAERLNMKPGATGGTGHAYKPGHRDKVEIYLALDALTQPIRWKRARSIFPCSMTDLFADFVPDDWIYMVFAVMMLAPRHNFQVLTKRPGRAAMLLSAPYFGLKVAEAAEKVAAMFPEHANRHPSQRDKLEYDARAYRENLTFGAPAVPKNIMLGTSISSQPDLIALLPPLAAAPVHRRFLSCEPLIGPLDLSFARMNGRMMVDWVIAGGESGPEARPTMPGWLRVLRDQCAAAGVPFHFKQWGEWAPDQEDECMVRVGTRNSGRLLDGVMHDAGSR